MNRKKHMEIFL